MEEKNQHTVEGYRFCSLHDASTANEEKKKAQYFEEKLEGRSAGSLLSVYDKVLDEKIFVTPIGWEYLKRTQKKLLEAGVPEERIRPIPLYTTFAFTNMEETENKGVAKEHIRPSTKKKKTLRAKLTTAVTVNVILVFMVVAMFVITLQGENANVINYRRAIINEYASWEKELSEREQAVLERESELQNLVNMENDTQNSQN